MPPNSTPERPPGAGARIAMPRHFTDLFDLEPEAALELLDRADRLKRDWSEGVREPLLAGRTLGLLFEKPSLRTRVSFEAAIDQLGGSAIFLPAKDVGIGVRESVADVARVLSQYVDALAVRTYAQRLVEELAEHATIPIINALTDSAHPCQAMADLMTVREALGTLDGVKLAFVGDGNNVAMSLAVACALTGARFALARPDGHDIPDSFRARYETAFPDRPLAITADPSEAVSDADVIYTDVWASMGQESEAESRRADFAPYQVDSRLFADARPRAIFLHCLPAHRGEEVTAEVLDGPRSLVVPQAANRLHFQKALLIWLLEPHPAPPGFGRDDTTNRAPSRSGS